MYDPHSYWVAFADEGFRLWRATEAHPLPGAKYGDVMPHGNFDDDWIVRTFGGIVFPEFRAQAPRLAPYNRVDFRVVIRVTAEDGNSDGRLLQVCGLAFQRRANDKLKELDQPVTLVHRTASTNALQGIPDVRATKAADEFVLVRAVLFGFFLSEWQVSVHIVVDASQR